jgi:hypothetical protein
MIAYLIPQANGHVESEVISVVVDFSWDSEIIRVKHHPEGLLVDVGDVVEQAAWSRLGLCLDTPIKPVETSDRGWQIVYRNTPTYD